MFRPLLAFGLIVGSLFVLVPRPTAGFTVKLLGSESAFGEGHVAGDLNKDDRVPIPDGTDVFPDPTGFQDPKKRGPIDVDGDIDRDEKDIENSATDNYLMKYGYLKPDAIDIIPDEDREAAIKAYQDYAGLQVTGVVDEPTREQMFLPRCGMADPVFKNTNADFKAVVRWSKKHLTYAILKYSEKVDKNKTRELVATALQMWSNVSGLTFSEVDSKPYDLHFAFESKIHGDQNPFDGRGGVLGHAFFPENGAIHLDDDENYTYESKKGTNLLFVLVHEIGHAIGLGHSKVDDAVMGPYYYGYTPDMKLSKDDIAGVQELYGKPETQTAAPPTGAPATKAPATKAPATKVPATKAPATKAPATKAPATKAPTTVVPATKSPPTKVPTTEGPGPSGPTAPERIFPCPFNFWAAMTSSNTTYGFMRRSVYELLPNGEYIKEQPIKALYPKGPRFVTAAAHNDLTGHTFLFCGTKVYRYTGEQLDIGFPQRLTKIIRNAVVVDGQLIAFSFKHVHYLDEDTMSDFVDGEVRIEDEYPALPYAIKSSVSYDDGIAYMLYTKKVIKLDVHSGEISVSTCKKKPSATSGSTR